MLRDPYQWPLTKSLTGKDLSLKVSANLAYNHLRNGLQTMLSLEHSLPAPKEEWSKSWLSFTRATGVLLTCLTKYICSTSSSLLKPKLPQEMALSCCRFKGQATH